MTVKRGSRHDAPPTNASEEARELRASWIEITFEAPLDNDGRATQPSLPGIEVQDEWLEPPPPLQAESAAPKSVGKPPVDPFLGMRLPRRPAPKDTFDDEAPTLPRHRA